MSKTLVDLSKEFVGRRALVTAGSRGIGAAIAQRLLDGGATVVVTARSPTEATPKGATFVKGGCYDSHCLADLATLLIHPTRGIGIPPHLACSPTSALPGSHRQSTRCPSRPAPREARRAW
jgi:hypothetical protein